MEQKAFLTRQSLNKALKVCMSLQYMTIFCGSWLQILTDEQQTPVAYPGIFFRGGGGRCVQQIQLGTEDRVNGDLGAVAT
jgi:hypothetical protein